MKKVTVEICCGTACYLLGAAKLIEIESELPEELKGLVDIEAHTCLEMCDNESLGGAPYVRFNGSEIMSRATKERVFARISELVNEGPQDA